MHQNLAHQSDFDDVGVVIDQQHQKLMQCNRPLTAALCGGAS
jgi:hypothetical protein